MLAMLAITTTAFAGYSPAAVQAALQKMYPDAKDIAWSQDDGYYCADFMMNGLEKNVWFNTQAQWVMIPFLISSSICVEQVPCVLYTNIQ